MKKSIVCLFMLCFCVLSKAQQVVSSGGYTEQSEISVDWILGGSLSDIPAYDADAMLAQQWMESGISFRVFPSPAVDLINIEIMPFDSCRLVLKLFDHSGAEMLNREIEYQPLLQVDISDIPCGIYYLKVFIPGNDQSFNVEKIVKIKTNPL